MLAKKIESLQHPSILRWVKLVQKKSFREEEKRLLITGEKLIREVASQKPLLSLITTHDAPSLPAKERYLVTEEMLQKVTSLPHPDGFAAEVALPPPQDLSQTGRLLILDRIADPGNLGTLLRTAYALGWEGVALTPGTVDLFNDKALRAAKGASLFLPYQEIAQEALLSWPHKKVVADLQGEPLQSLLCTPPVALILSHEAEGARDWPKSQKVTIAMHRRADSLNVAMAGAIFLYEMRPL